MTTVEIVMAVVMFAIAGLWLFLGIRSFMERGFLLNNAYIYARLPLPLSYTQSCLLFCIISAQSNTHRFKHTLPESRRNRRLSGSVVMPETGLRAPDVKKLL